MVHLAPSFIMLQPKHLQTLESYAIQHTINQNLTTLLGNTLPALPTTFYPNQLKPGTQIPFVTELYFFPRHQLNPLFRCEGGSSFRNYQTIAKPGHCDNVAPGIVSISNLVALNSEHACMLPNRCLPITAAEPLLCSC